VIHFGNISHGFEIAAAVPRNYNPVKDIVISRTREEKLLGGVIFEGYTGSAIFAHQAAFDKHWLSRDMLWVLFDYPFNQLNCKKIIGTIPSCNLELLVFNRKLGFKLEYEIADAYPDGAMSILSMTRADCRWLNLKPRGLRAGSE
jgi:RimJ/RimL family protein N-acetyltransferase